MKTPLKLLILGAFLAVFGCISAYSQAPAASPTPETVTISREAAVKCLENGDKVTAYEAEIKAKDAAIADLKDIITDLKVKLAGQVGRNTEIEATLVRYNALIDILIKNARLKKIGIINLF